jgi:peptidoglycan hydrolase CwlO-like protein
LQQEAIKDLVAEKATAEMVANSYAAVNKKQEELIKNRKDIAETSETIEELEKKLEKLR